MSGRPQFLSVREVGRLESADVPGYTMAQYARAPHRAYAETGGPDRYRPRKFRKLVQEVRKDGAVTRPITIGPGERGLAVWDGHHRYRAARLAGVTHVPVEWSDDVLEAVGSSYAGLRAKGQAFNEGAR